MTAADDDAPQAAWSTWVRRVAITTLSLDLLVALVGVPRFLVAEPTAGQRSVVFLGLALGPATGWIETLGSGHVVQGLPMLLVMTLGTLVPLGLAVTLRSRAALVLGALGWFFSGYLFTIAIWA